MRRTKIGKHVKENRREVELKKKREKRGNGNKENRHADRRKIVLRDEKRRGVEGEGGE